MRSGREEIFFFEGGNGKRLLGFLYHPAEGGGGTGIVYCHPFAEEKNLSHAVVARTARRLAESGFPVLRFDASGCGDSEGEFADASMEDWLADTGAAEEALRRKTGVASVGFWGLRTGANQALIHAQGRKGVPFLMLWQPVPGLADFLRIFLRQSISTSLAKGQGAKLTVKDLVRRIEEGGVAEVIGYGIGKRLHESMIRFDGQSLPPEIDCPLCLFTIGPSGIAPLKVVAWGEGRRTAGFPVDMENIEATPFWDRLWQWEAPELAQRTVEWARSRKSVPAG